MAPRNMQPYPYIPAKTQEVMGIFWIQAIVFIQMPIDNKVIRAEIETKNAESLVNSLNM